MLAHEEQGHIAGFIPRRFTRHVVRNHPSVDFEVLEDYILDVARVIITGDHGEVGVRAVICDVFEQDVFDPSAGRSVVLSIEHNAQIYQLPFAKIFDADVLEPDVANQVAVARIEAHATLIVDLRFMVVEDIEIDELQSVKSIGVLGIPMRAYKDGMPRGSNS